MYNHTGLQGRLTADPELRYTQQGTAITSFTLASDTGRKTKDGKKVKGGWVKYDALSFEDVDVAVAIYVAKANKKVGNDAHMCYQCPRCLSIYRGADHNGRRRI